MTMFIGLTQAPLPQMSSRFTRRKANAIIEKYFREEDEDVGVEDLAPAVVNNQFAFQTGLAQNTAFSF
jgi:hypothetical protein